MTYIIGGWNGTLFYREGNPEPLIPNQFAATQYTDFFLALHALRYVESQWGYSSEWFIVPLLVAETV